jgi:hypothetical protein
LSALKKAKKEKNLIHESKPIGLLDPLSIPLGANNPLIEELYFEIG